MGVMKLKLIIEARPNGTAILRSWQIEARRGQMPQPTQKRVSEMAEGFKWLKAKGGGKEEEEDIDKIYQYIKYLNIRI